MLAAPFGAGVGVYGFYAAQPYLLELYGDSEAYAVAALSAALVAGAQNIGGLLVPRIARIFHRRTSVLLAGTALTVGVLVPLGLTSSFRAAIVLLALWSTAFALMGPVRQAYLNGLIPSAQRATVLSSDNLLSSAGGAVAQPGLGKVADVWSYGTSYVVSAGIELLALPFVALARRERAALDRNGDGDVAEPSPSPVEALVGTGAGDQTTPTCCMT
jgi:MFS family permease